MSPAKQRVDRSANLLDAATFACAHRGECLVEAFFLFVRELWILVRACDDMTASRPLTRLVW
jgi:hypothetical protein